MEGQDITPPPTMQDEAIAPTYFVTRKGGVVAALIATDELPDDLDVIGDLGPVGDIQKARDRILAKMICQGENLDVPNRKYKYGKGRCPTCGRRGPPPDEVNEVEGKGKEPQRLGISRRPRQGSILSNRSASPDRNGHGELPTRDRSPLTRHSGASGNSSVSGRENNLGRGERMRKEILGLVLEEQATRKGADSDSHEMQVDQK